MKAELSARDYGLIAAGAALLLDQATKLILLYGLGFAAEPYQSHVIPVFPFFNVVMVWNPGVSYGLLAAHTLFARVLLVVLALALIAGLAYWMWHTTRLTLAIGLGLVIGGAIGNNLIDRIIYGQVADFFHFYAYGYDWYVFNVADAAITFGVIAMLYDALLKPESKPAGSSSG